MESLVQRKITHVKARPTYTNINNLYILVKNLENPGNIEIPKLDNTSVEGIEYFCQQIEKFLTINKTMKNVVQLRKQESFYTFEESLKLPQIHQPKNTTTKIEEEEEEDLDDEISGSDEDENSENSEIDQEDGYELYEEDDDEAEFSD